MCYQKSNPQYIMAIFIKPFVWHICFFISINIIYCKTCLDLAEIDRGKYVLCIAINRQSKENVLFVFCALLTVPKARDSAIIFKFVWYLLLNGRKKIMLAPLIYMRYPFSPAKFLKLNKALYWQGRGRHLRIWHLLTIQLTDLKYQKPCSLTIKVWEAAKEP